MGLFNRNKLWDTLDDVGHFDGSIPWYSNWRGRRFGKAAAVIVLFAGIAYLANQMEKKTQAIWTNVKVNKQIFADSSFIADTSDHSITLYRKVRPINIDDVNKMKIPRWKKLKLISQVDTNSNHNTPVMIPSNVIYFKDNMFKSGTSCIGTFLKRDSITAEKPPEGLHADPQKWLAIAPNYTVADTTNYLITMPANYTYEDSYYYTDLSQIDLVEAPIFKNSLNKSQTPVAKINNNRSAKNGSTHAGLSNKKKSKKKKHHTT